MLTSSPMMRCNMYFFILLSFKKPIDYSEDSHVTNPLPENLKQCGNTLEGIAIHVCTGLKAYGLFILQFLLMKRN